MLEGGDDEIARRFGLYLEGVYLRSQSLSRLATVGPDLQPHVVPVTFWYNAEEDTIDIGSVDYASGTK